MWFALVLPLLVLPALVAFSRFEQRVMSGSPRVRTAPADAAQSSSAGGETRATTFA